MGLYCVVWLKRQVLKTLLFISLACVSSETHNLQRVFRRILYTNGPLCQAFLAETVETGTKNRWWSKPRMFCEESFGKIKSRAFPKRVGARILSLESVDYFGTSVHYWEVDRPTVLRLWSYPNFSLCTLCDPPGLWQGLWYVTDVMRDCDEPRKLHGPNDTKSLKN